MARENTAMRLKTIMEERNLRQVDVLNLCKPFCEKYKIKMNKSDMSQYCSGKNEPMQDKVYILSKALNVSEAWLMGYDVPRERKNSDDAENFGAYAATINETYCHTLKASDEEFDVIKKYRYIDDYGKRTVNVVLDSEYDRCKDESERTIELSEDEIERLKIEKYLNDNSTLLVARKRKGD